MGDSIGSLISFVSLILLLSLVSTFLTQSTSSMMRLRGRNLYRGLRETFRLAKEPDTTPRSPGAIARRATVSTGCGLALF
jgi:hypothetical protein